MIRLLTGLNCMLLGTGMAGWLASPSRVAAAAPNAGFAALAGAPLCFEPASRETSAQPKFLARGADFQFAIGPAGADLTLRKSNGRLARGALERLESIAPAPATTRGVSMEFLGANLRAEMSGQQPLTGKVNYLVGNDPVEWRSNIPTYAQVRVQELYPGIDVIYYGNHRQLEYDFTLAPGTDPELIRIRFHGADGLRVDENGAVALTLDGDRIYQHQPVIYQLFKGVRKSIKGGYQLVAPDTIGFVVGAYDRSLPLIIDPVLSYASFFGGNGHELALGVKVDAQGAIYVAGETLSTVFSSVPTNTPGFQKKFKGGTVSGDAFVAKFDSTGSNLLYFTYVGGGSDDAALDLALDGQGHAFITGFTASPNFPTTTNALSRHIHGLLDPSTSTYPNDAFVAELSADGTSLVYSTYLGGAWYEVAGGIAVDPIGNVYVTGYTTSSNFPTAGGTNIIQKKFAGAFDAFVTKFAPGGSNLVYSTYLGGNKKDEGQGIAVDAKGFAYVTGYTVSWNFPVTNAFTTNLNRSTGSSTKFDAFVAKLTPEGRLGYSTYLGGFDNDYGYRIATDLQGNAYVTGVSTSIDFPNVHSTLGLPPGWVTSRVLNYDPFLTKIGSGTNGGAQIVYSILFGGAGNDVGWGVAVDPAGDAFIVGTTYSVNFPSIHTNVFLRASNAGRADVFITAINRDATAVLYSDYLGGSADDFGYAIAVDSQSTAYVVGRTLSTNFPVVPSGQALQRARQGKSDGFVAKIIMEPLLFQSMAGNELQLSWPPSALSYVLESSPGLSAPTWTEVAQSPVLVNGYYQVTLPTSGSGSFFRLRRPGN